MYTLFTGDNCTQCAHVEKYLSKHNIEYKKVNVDHSTERPPVQIFAFPALFEADILLRYGTDIEEYFKKKSQML